MMRRNFVRLCRNILAAVVVLVADSHPRDQQDPKEQQADGWREITDLIGQILSLGTLNMLHLGRPVDFLDSAEEQVQ